MFGMVRTRRESGLWLQYESNYSHQFDGIQAVQSSLERSCQCVMFPISMDFFYHLWAYIFSSFTFS